MTEAFVIHFHSGFGQAHYDLMLQAGAALATWRLPKDPAGLDVGGELVALRLPDHREAYLTYEGPVSRGRGEVRRAHGGSYELVRRDADTWEFFLASDTCRGRFALCRRADAPDDEWSLTRLPDPP